MDALFFNLESIIFNQKMSVLIFIIILAILVLVHELGHFIVAKKSGIRVDEFGLGFPPKLWSKKWRGTLYTLNAIPFGGFVKIYGEDAHSVEIQTDEDKKRSFVYKSKWIQAAVLVAGVTMNVIFAWFVISISFLIGVPASSDYGGFGKVSDVKLSIVEVLADSPAGVAGLIPGDVINKVTAGQSVLSGEDLTPEKVRNLIATSQTGTVEIEYIENQTKKSVSVVPSLEITPGKRTLGIVMDSTGILKLPIHLAPLEGVRTTGLIIKNTATGLLSFLTGIFTFKSDFSQVAGPIGIAKVVGEANKLGFVYLLTLTSLISVNLALINLLPFPALDGGRLLFVLIEGITRRPINAKFVRWVNTAGFAFLLLLMIAVTAHDIWKIF